MAIAALKDADLPREFFRRMETGDYQGLGELFDENIVVEFPYNPQGAPLRGRASVLKFMLDTIPNFFSTIKFEIDAVYPVTDGTTYLVECRSQGARTDGKPYANRYVQVFKIKNGKFTLWREYFNPLAVVDA